MTALQLTGLVNFKNALPPLPPLCLLFGSVPALFILVFLLLLALVVSLRFKVSKVKVPAKNFLGFLQCSAQTLKVEKLTNTILHRRGKKNKHFLYIVYFMISTYASVYPENFLLLPLARGRPSSSTMKSSISVL